MSDNDTIRIFGLANDSIVDGPGLRYAIFVQGCTHDCPGCHNPESHDPNGGKAVPIVDIVSYIDENQLIEGVTISGGEPFDQPKAVAELASRLKASGYNIWTYTGYLIEDLMASDDHVDPEEHGRARG